MHKLCLTAHVLKTVYEIELTLSYLEVLWGSAHTRRYNKNIHYTNMLQAHTDKIRKLTSF